MNKRVFIIFILNIHGFLHASFLEDPLDEYKNNTPSALSPLFQKKEHLNTISTITVSHLSSPDQASLGSTSRDICDMVNFFRLRVTIQALVHIGNNTPHIQRLFQESVFQGWNSRAHRTQENSVKYYHEQFCFLNALMQAAHYNVPLVPFLTTSNNNLVPLEHLLTIPSKTPRIDLKSISGEVRHSNDTLKKQHLYHFNRFKKMLSPFSGHLREADMKHLICQQMDLFLRFDPNFLEMRLMEVSQYKDDLFPSSLAFGTKKAVFKACLQSPVQDILARIANIHQIMFTIFPRGLTDWEETAWLNIYITLTPSEFRKRLQAYRDFGSAFFSKSSMFLERKIINQQDRASIMTLCLAIPPEKTQLLSENASLFFPRRTHSIHDRPSLLCALSYLSDEQILILVAHADRFSFLSIDTHDLIDCLEELKDLSVKQLDAVGLYAQAFFPEKMDLMSRINKIKFLKKYTPTQIISLGNKVNNHSDENSKHHPL